MPIDRIEIVNGYRDLCNLAVDASAWLFIYPRNAWLLQKYGQAVGGQKCKLIIWIGPRADLLEHKNEFFGEMWIKEDFEESKNAVSKTTRLWHWRRDPLDKAGSRATRDDPSAIL